MVRRLLYLNGAIEVHESVEKIKSLPSETDWEVLRLTDPVLEPSC